MINIQEIIDTPMEELYGKLNSIGSEALKTKDLERIAEVKFSIKLRGGTKKQKFEQILNFIYQSNYYDMMERKYKKSE